MIIKIDTRESEIYSEIVDKNLNESIKIDSLLLPLGDIIICNDEGNEVVVIERKTLADLASSIKDGRYKEQGYRLNNCHLHNHNIIYLVEGDLQKYNEVKSRLERKSLISSFVSLTYFKGFSLHRTNSISESVEWILSYANKLKREKQTSFYDGNKEEDQCKKSYVDVCSRVKKNNVTQDNIASIMLSQIPSVSANIASVIMSRYGTLKKLIDDLTNNPNALDDITITTKTNKQRKIPKTTCRNIHQYLVIEDTK
tara:strand:+ start:42 stop:806 length:765 start_codon:yes stop_codon:yes gene_type:complete